MSEFSEDDLSEVIDDFVLQKSFRDLSKIVTDINVGGPNADIDDLTVQSLRSALSEVRSSTGMLQKGKNKTLSNLLETIFRAQEILLAQHGSGLKEHSMSSASYPYKERKMPNKDEGSGKSEVISSVCDHFKIVANDTQSMIKEIDRMVSDAPNAIVRKIAQSFELPITTSAYNVVQALENRVDQLAHEKAQQLKAKADEDEDDSFNDAPLFRNEDPENPSVSRKQLVATVKSLRNELKNLSESVADQNQILKPFEDIPIKSDDIKNIIISDSPILDKVKSIVDILSLHIFSSEDIMVSNQKLLSLASGLFRFLSSIGSSKSAYTSIYSDTPFEDMRGVLISQAERIQLFLNDNAMGIVQDNSLFETLINKGNNKNLLDNVSSYLKEFHTPQTIEAEQLYICLMEAIAAADVLRKFSAEAKNACQRQLTDVRDLKDYSKKLEQSIEIQQTETLNSIQESNERADYTVNAVKSILRKAVLTGQHNLEPVLDSLDVIEDTNIITQTEDVTNDQEYLKALQKQLDQLRQTNMELKKGREALIKQTQNDLLRVQEQVAKMKDSTKKRMAQKRKENSQLSNALREANEKIEELTRENEDLQSQLEHMDSESEVRSAYSKSNTNNDRNHEHDHEDERSSRTNRSEKTNRSNRTSPSKANNDPIDESDNLDNENSKELIKEIQEQFTDTKEEYERVIQSVKKEVEEYQESKQREFDAAKSSFENLLKKAQSDLDNQREENSRLKREIQRLEDEIEEYKDQLNESKRAEDDALDQAEKISKKYQEIHEDLTILEEEKKRISTRLESSEKNASIYQNILKDHRELNDSYSTLLQQFDESRTESTREMQEFLNGIAQLFTSYVDLTNRLDTHSILEMLKRVRDDVSGSSSASSKLQKKETILSQTREALKVEKDSQIPAEVLNLVRQHTKSSEDAAEKAKENKALQDSRLNFLQIQDWLIRMYVLCSGGVCQDVTTAEMENTVEDALVANFGNMIQARKLGLLKAEKKLLNSGILQAKAEKTKLSFRHILIVMMLVVKTKRLSGHMESAYTFENVQMKQRNSPQGRELSINTTETESDFFPISPNSNQPLSPISKYGTPF